MQIYVFVDLRTEKVTTEDGSEIKLLGKQKATQSLFIILLHNYQYL